MVTGSIEFFGLMVGMGVVPIATIFSVLGDGEIFTMLDSVHLASLVISGVSWFDAVVLTGSVQPAVMDKNITSPNSRIETILDSVTCDRLIILAPYLNVFT